VSDCVIKLDNRVSEQTSSRHLRIVKYRGSTHGTNEYPFLIDKDGFSVMPITSLGLQHKVSSEHVSTGVARLDTMLNCNGFYKGSTILISGTAGTGKSSLAAHFVDAACRRGERAIYFAFEESPDQIIRNMHSIGIDLGQWVEQGLLRVQASRPTLSGLEMHLAQMHKAISDFRPHVVVADPINSFLKGSNLAEVKTMLILLVDLLKTAQITALFTSLTASGGSLEQSEVGISSIIDTWVIVKYIESNGEHNRGLYILKSRGMNHSNQIREFLLTDKGVDLCDVYIGERGVLTGSARLIQEAQEKAALLTEKQEIELRESELERKRKVVEAHIAVLRAEFEVEELAAKKILKQEEAETTQIAQEKDDMKESRMVDVNQDKKKGS
jgi:circadian clock protein KaiC